MDSPTGELDSDQSASLHRQVTEATLTTEQAAVHKIAKDTGCCLYSAISSIIVMLAIVGIILIFTGPSHGIYLRPVEQLVNASGESNTGISYDYDDGTGHDVAAQELYPASLNLTDESSSSSSSSNETADGVEDLGSIAPEAVRLAFIPIAIDDDDDVVDVLDDQHESGGDDAQVNQFSSRRIATPWPTRPQPPPHQRNGFNGRQRPPMQGVNMEMFGTLAQRQRPYRYGLNRRNQPPHVRGPASRPTAVTRPTPYRPAPPPQQFVRTRPVPMSIPSSGELRSFTPGGNRPASTRVIERQRPGPSLDIPSQQQRRPIDNYRRAVTPKYTYPKEAMSIQDIISHMTALQQDQGRNSQGSERNQRPSSNRQSQFSRQDSRQSSRPREPLSLNVDVYPVRQTTARPEFYASSGSSQSGFYDADLPRVRYAESERYRNRYVNTDEIKPGWTREQNDDDRAEAIGYPFTKNGKWRNFPELKSNAGDVTKYRNQADDWRPGPPGPTGREEPEKGRGHSVVVHLNVYNPKQTASRKSFDTTSRVDCISEYDEDCYEPLSTDEDYEQYSKFSPAKRERFDAGISDGLSAGISRVSISSQTTDAEPEVDDPLKNHQMTNDPGAFKRSQSTNPSHDPIEPLPTPSPLNQHHILSR